MKIYLARNNVQAGPYTLDELNTMLSSGEVLLDDLAWHKGMSQWQKLGELTQGQLHYAPVLPKSASTVAPSQTTTAPQQRDFGDNPDFHPTDDALPKTEDKKRVSVADLYGRATPEQAKTTQERAPQSMQPKVGEQAIYASIGSRFLATVVNFVLFLLSLLPFLQSFMSLNPDPVKLNTGAFTERMAYAQELATQIAPQAMTLTSALILSYVVIQLILIIARGQSFGKMVVGIRTVDDKTHDKPNFFKRVILRVLLLFVIYQVASGLPVPINLSLILLMINYFIASRDRNRQGWHDKLAGTVVVKTSSVPFKKK
ncbi:RDD family protein [Moraxella sp. FZLJ2107]|uniref:RDD family protein n=1 Tax=unclassified Moraxella TaxID=2685852 RepID=UPI0020C87A9A|nr:MULTISPECIES: RDD family protein [unclassified Moraxella]UTO05236.1 RDD family protein [Moraxella sp. FZLJ2107]UTO21971.1 RDD family protein [Moraxella sp. FZLJ2109]